MSVLYRHTFTWQLNEKKKVWVLDGKKKKKGLVLIKEIKEATKSRLWKIQSLLERYSDAW